MANKGIQFRKISAYKAVKEIYSHPNSWEFLHTFVEDSEEVEIGEDGEIYFIYYDGESTKHNYFTNEDEYFWIGGYDNGRLNFLQLVHWINDSHIDLVVAQKKAKAKSKEYFGKLVSYISNNYTAKYLTTFPMNDKLKRYYIDNGFYEHNKELRLDLKL